MKENLLDRLARESGTAMLSDLHGYISRGKIYDAVCGISSEEYSLKEWEEAAGYILGEKHRTSNLPGRPAGISAIV